MSDPTDMTPESYYDRHPDREEDRLEAVPTGRLEFDVTRLELEDALPQTGRVLDAGGGPGRYTVWLANHAYTVEHCDISAEQVRLARERVTAAGVEAAVTCRKADLRDLPYDDDAFDAVCCLGGPLSHLIDPQDRQLALEELHRVVRPDNPVVISVMGRLAALKDTIKHVLPDASGPYSLLEELAADGRYTQDRVDTYRGGEGWAETKFFRLAELESEIEAAGLSVERSVGLEGVASNLAPELQDLEDPAVSMVEDVVKSMRADPVIVDHSEHMLLVCSAAK